MGKVIIGISLLIIVGIIGLTQINKDDTTNQDSQTLSYGQFQPTGNLQSTTQPTESEKKITVDEKEFSSGNQATIKTEKGDIVIELYPEEAPKTVTNFATLSKLGYYDDLTFHRVVPGFVIQGGDPNGNGTGGESIYGDKFEDELDPNTPSAKEGYKEGVVAMANSGPNTNGSQFFIMLADNPLPHQYSIFGKVTSGIEVVKQIQIGDKITTIEIE